MDFDFRMVHRPMGHDFRCPELIAAMDQVNDAGELGQIIGLLDGRVAAADDDQGLVPESRQGPVAHGTGADAPILERFFRGQAEVIRPGPGGHDHRQSLVGFAV